MTENHFAEPRPYLRAEAERAFGSTDPATVCDALVGATYHEADWRWVQGWLARLAEHSSSDVRGLVATCLGHLARIHGMLDRARAEVVLARLATDPDPTVAGRVGDARDDFEVYLADGPSSRPAS